MVATADLRTRLHAITRDDGWENVLTGLGIKDRDKRLGGEISPLRSSTSFALFEEMFHGDFMAGVIAELPAQEMTRKWINLKIDAANIDDGGDLQLEAEKEALNLADETQMALTRLKARHSTFEAVLWARVFGGAIIFMAIDDGNEKLEEPLNEDRIREFKSLIVFDRFNVHVHTFHTDINHPKFGEPELYQIHPVGLHGAEINASQLIHETRVLRFDGVITSRRRRARNRGWHDSIYIRLEDMLRDYGLAWASVAHILQDFAQAIFKMKNLAEKLDADKSDDVIARLGILDLCRSVARAVPIDSEGEDFIRAQTPVTGIPELLDRFGNQMAGASRIPVKLLLGEPQAGLGGDASGKSDFRVFYDHISANQEDKLRDPLERLIELIFKSPIVAGKPGPTGGKAPDVWKLEFNPLWQMDDEQKAKVRRTTSEADAIDIEHEVLTPDEVSASRYGGDTYSTDTNLNKKQRLEDSLREPEPEPEPLPEPEPEPNPGPEPGNPGHEPKKKKKDE